MSSSFQQQPYMTNNPEKIVAQNAMPHSTSNSYTPVFIVLAIIAVVSVASCIIGQFCSRRYLRPRRRKDHVAYNMENGVHKVEARVEPVTEEAAPANLNDHNAVVVTVLDAKN